MISRSRSGPTAAAMSIECTTSANSTVTCLYSADGVALCDWCTALVTELGARWQFGAARPTEQPRRGQPTATVPAGVHVSIISPLVNDRAAHHWSQAKLKTQAGFFQRLHWPAVSAPRLLSPTSVWLHCWSTVSVISQCHL